MQIPHGKGTNRLLIVRHEEILPPMSGDVAAWRN